MECNNYINYTLTSKHTFLLMERDLGAIYVDFDCFSALL